MTATVQAMNLTRPSAPPQQRDLVDEDDDIASNSDENPFSRGNNAAVIARRVADHDEDDDDYRWEHSFTFEIPKFHGSQSAEELLDWIITMEEILEFKRMPLDRCVPVIAMRFCNCDAAWWTQLKVSRARLGKPKIIAWGKLKSHMHKTFLPYNYDQVMF